MLDSQWVEIHGLHCRAKSGGKWWTVVNPGERPLRLTGVHLQTMDDRLRLAVPAKLVGAFRQISGVTEDESLEVVVAVTKDERVGVFPKQHFMAMIERLEQEAEYDPDAEELLTGYVNYMDEQSLDKQNRFRIPQMLAESFALSGEVAVVGSRNCLEVVNKAILDQQLKQVVGRMKEQDAKLRIARGARRGAEE